MNLSSFRQQGGSGLYMRERRFFFDCQQTYTWTVPDGVTKVFAFVIGGGGGGGRRDGNDSNETQSAGGGAGGGYAHGYIATTPGSTYTITVGKGGRGAARSVSSQAGTASSFGSNLTGNGGAAGPNSVTGGDNNDGTTAWGQGGQASTSNVTEGYTAAGGGTGPGQNRSYIGYYCGAAATGGGSSGSPFGKGSNRPLIAYSSSNGGAGWSTGSYKNQGWQAYVAYASDNQANGNAHGGDGSHHMNPWSPGTYQGKAANCAGKGGAGLQAMGGDWRIYRFQNGEPRDNVNGQNGNPNWWFPWDIDGGGGGGSVWNGSVQTNDVDNTARGGNGGPGAGGGGSHVDRQTYNIGHGSVGGDGGFGGGGGAACAWGKYQNNQHGCPSRGGNGGIGGGGGGCWTVDRMHNTNPHITYGGNGGKGIVAVYW